MPRAPLLAALLVVAACSPGRATLFVDLRTDLRPGAELGVVVVSLPGEARREEHAVDVDADYLSGVRVATFRDLPRGDAALRLDAHDADGHLVTTQRVRLEVRAETAVTVLVTRDCAGVDCDDPAAPAACVAGACVAEECAAAEALCAGSECARDADCVAPVACATPRCVAGACLFGDEGACGSGEYCDLEAGCAIAPVALSPLPTPLDLRLGCSHALAARGEGAGALAIGQRDVERGQALFFTVDPAGAPSDPVPLGDLDEPDSGASLVATDGGYLALWCTGRETDLRRAHVRRLDATGGVVAEAAHDLQRADRAECPTLRRLGGRDFAFWSEWNDSSVRRVRVAEVSVDLALVDGHDIDPGSSGYQQWPRHAEAGDGALVLYSADSSQLRAVRLDADALATGPAQLVDSSGDVTEIVEDGAGGYVLGRRLDDHYGPLQLERVGADLSPVWAMPLELAPRNRFESLTWRAAARDGRMLVVWEDDHASLVVQISAVLLDLDDDPPSARAFAITRGADPYLCPALARVGDRFLVQLLGEVNGRYALLHAYVD